MAETSQPTQMRQLCSGRMNQPRIRWWSRDPDRMVDVEGQAGGLFSAKVSLALDRGITEIRGVDGYNLGLRP